jgi:hypothetical protein
MGGPDRADSRRRRPRGYSRACRSPKRLDDNHGRGSGAAQEQRRCSRPYAEDDDPRSSPATSGLLRDIGRRAGSSAVDAWPVAARTAANTRTSRAAFAQVRDCEGASSGEISTQGRSTLDAVARRGMMATVARAGVSRQQRPADQRLLASIPAPSRS